MTAAKLSEADFISEFQGIGPAAMNRKYGLTQAAIFRRRTNLEAKLGRPIRAPDHPNATERPTQYPGRISAEVRNGIVLIGSDAHYWPGVETTAHRAFVRFCKELKPEIVVANGDIFDGASVSRHAPIMWETKPTVIQELEACQERLGEIEKAAFKARKIWTLGNHDARFETRLATQAPEYANVHGVHLKDHFGPQWEPCWSLWINDGEAVIKHRNKGGIHATRNNTLNSGLTIVTGHLHSLKVTPLTDYRGTRWGVDTGTLADVFGPQFEYLEDNARDWRGGFAVLSFHERKLLWPEVVDVVDEGKVSFRGRVIAV